MHLHESMTHLRAVDQYRALLPVLLYPRGQVVSHKVLRMARRKMSDASKVSRDFWSKHTNLSQELNQAFLAQRPPGNFRLSIYRAITIVPPTLLEVRCPIHR